MIRSRYPPVYRLPAALAVAGPTFLVAVTRGDFLPLAVAWLIASFAVASIRNRAIRIGVTVTLMPVCLLTAFEGGLFMLPAALTMLALDLNNPTATTSNRPPSHSQP
jgi:hypothetical protein